MVLALISLKSNFLIIELFQLNVESLDKFLIVGQISLCKLKLLSCDRLTFL